MRSVVVSVLACLSLVVPCLGQEVPPALFVESGGKATALQLSRVEIVARVEGPVAETRMTMVFANPHNRALAGDLYFPLPEGATVSGYALDVNGVMVDGVVVEKNRARRVFETEQRKGVDPGLVEWVKGASFKTRVFPIPARGSRTVMVRYVSELAESADGAVLELPLAFRDRVGELALRVEVVKPGPPPRVLAGGPAGFSFAAWREGYLAEATLKGATLTDDLRVALPAVEQQPVTVERGSDGQWYFAVTELPVDPRAPGERTSRSSPARVAVVWDASGSRAAADHGRELELLQAYLAGLGRPQVEVDLVVLRNTAEPARSFRVTDGDAAALLTAIRKVEFDGGTCVGCLARPAAGVAPDLYLLFSDGLSTFGPERPGDLGAPLWAVTADAAADHPSLRALALATGGDAVNLNRTSVREAAAAIGRGAFSFLSVAVEPAGAAELAPGLPQPVRGRFTLAGRLLAPAARLTVRYGVAGRELLTRAYSVSRGGASDGDLLRFLWAEKKLGDLLLDPAGNADEMTRLGKAHGLVTPGTSLLVLETLEQYVEHGIAPPQSLPEMRRAFEQAVEQRRVEKQRSVEEKLDRVAEQWRARVEWWQQKPKYSSGFKFSTEPGSGASGGSRERGEPRPSARTEQEVEAPAALEDYASDGAVPAAPAEADAERKADGTAGEAPEPGVALRPWDPQTPYLAALKKAPPERALAAYLEQRRSYADSPAFYLDCADFFAAREDDVTAVRVLSNLAELRAESPPLLRVLAHRLATLDRLELAAAVFEEVLRLRPEEPQSYRDLALLLARRGDNARAVELLYEVVKGRWDRFDEVEVVALMEINAILARAKAAGQDTVAVDPRLVRLLDLDLRIVMTWDADLTDMDLWVTEPSGEKAFYGHNRTTIGGLVSKDFTQGYGPEEYCLRQAMSGSYTVQANFYGSRSTELVGSVTVQVDVFTNFGRANEKRRSLTLRLTGAKDTYTVGEVEF